MNSSFTRSVPSCPDPPLTVENGMALVYTPLDRTFHHGDNITYLCNRGYHLEGDPEGLMLDIQCAGGSWSENAVKCVGRYSQTCSKDHLYIETTCIKRPHFTGPQWYTSHVTEPAYKRPPVYEDHILFIPRGSWKMLLIIENS